MEGESKRVVDREEFESFLRENALHCYKGMQILTLGAHNEIIEVNSEGLVKRFEGANVYNCYEEVIGVLYQGEYYALSETKKNIKILQDFGIIKAEFFIYLNEDEYPKDKVEKNRWMEILIQGSKQRKEEFKEECEKWAAGNSIKPLPQYELKNCFLIPEEGFRIRLDDDYDQEEPCSPIVSYLTPRSIEYVGSYSVYHNRVIFVTTDGLTYMAKGNHIPRLLKYLKFREILYFIPFSDNEFIIDEKIRSEWEKIPEINDPESP